MALSPFSSKEADNNCSYHYDNPLCLHHLETQIYKLMLKMNPDFQRDIVYLCIGTDRATGDSLGPLVGTRLQTLNPSLKLFGTLEKPSHAVNLQEVLKNMFQQYANPLVIAVDASLGNTDRVGYINIKPGGLKPGTALNKVLPMVGDFHISAVVNIGGYWEQMILQNTRLYVVYKMADLIARSLYLAHSQYNSDKTHYLMHVCDY